MHIPTPSLARTGIPVGGPETAWPKYLRNELLSLFVCSVRKFVQFMAVAIYNLQIAKTLGPGHGDTIAFSDNNDCEWVIGPGVVY